MPLAAAAARVAAGMAREVRYGLLCRLSVAGAGLGPIVRLPECRAVAHYIKSFFLNPTRPRPVATSSIVAGSGTSLGLLYTSNS